MLKNVLWPKKVITKPEAVNKIKNEANGNDLQS